MSIVRVLQAKHEDSHSSGGIVFGMEHGMALLVPSLISYTSLRAEGSLGLAII